MTYPIRKKKTNTYPDWPKFNHIQDIQSFIDTMCQRYSIPAIHVRVVPKWYMEKYARRAIAVAQWWGLADGIDHGREIWFCTEHFGYPTATYEPKQPVQAGSPVNVMRTVIHEFSHHVAMHRHGVSIRPHGFTFWRICTSIEASFGIFAIPFTRIAWKWPRGWTWRASAVAKEVRFDE